MDHHFDWIVPDLLLASHYPATDGALGALQAAGVKVIINLTDQPHPPARLEKLGITAINLPVPDFTAPDRAILETAVKAITSAHAAGEAVAVHCRAGLGRTGTVVASWLVSQGLDAEEAIQRVRTLRPGSIETASQVQAVRTFADLL